MWKNRSLLIGLLLLIAVAGSAAAGQPNDVEGLVSVKRTPTTITVGGSDADLPGFTSQSIQLAIDALTTRGGGTVQLGPGTFTLSGPVRLTSNITLQGSGPETVLKKSDGIVTRFVLDADYGMIKITVADPAGFDVGTGLQLFDDLHNGGYNVTTAVVTAVNGDVLFIDTPTLHDYIAAENGVISNAFPMVSGVDVENVKIANLVIDGNRQNNDYINGCRGGGVYLHRARDCEISNVHVRDFNGDSFSWQVTENITVVDCEASGGSGLGFHPGTGSVFTRMERNVSHHNDQDGIFLCWRVQRSLFRENKSYANGRHGVSIGHKDTDNVFEDNEIYENGRHGVAFRNENEQNSGHRNLLERNRIEDNGQTGEPAFGVYVGGVTEGVVLRENTIRSTGRGHQVGAVWVGPQAGEVSMELNRIEGHPEVVRDGPKSTK